MSIKILRQLWSRFPWLLSHRLWYPGLHKYMAIAILSDPSPSINAPQLTLVFHWPRFCLQVTKPAGQKGRCGEDLSTSASGCREDALTSELDLLWAGDWSRWSPHAPSNLTCFCCCVFNFKIPQKPTQYPFLLTPLPSKKPQPTL